MKQVNIQIEHVCCYDCTHSGAFESRIKELCERYSSFAAPLSVAPLSAAHPSVARSYEEVLLHLLFPSSTYLGVLINPYLYYLHSISSVITLNIAVAKQTVALGNPYISPSQGIVSHPISDAKNRSKLGTL